MQEPPDTHDIKGHKLYQLAEAVANGEVGDFLYSLQDGKFLIYEQGVWQHITNIEFLSKMQEGLIRDNRTKSGEQWIIQKGKILTKFTPQQKNNILDHFKLLKFKKLSEFNTLQLINLENYMFDPIGYNILDHHKDYYSTIRIPYKYDSSAICELWIKTLDGIFEGDASKILALQEFFGHCLTRDNTQEKALLLLGESRSGKSTILNTLQYMIGDGNCSHVSLAHLDNPQYTSMMINKLVNIDGEVSKKAEAFEAQFKTIVTGHEVNCNDKYMPPFKFRPFCKFVMSANEFPRITDHSSAFYKRLILIPCDRVFDEKEQNRGLRVQLLSELPGILNWAIEGLKRLNTRGMFEQNDFMKNAVKNLEDDNNPANAFIDEHVVFQNGSYEIKNELFNKYVKWCDDNHSYELSAALFGKCIYKKFPAMNKNGRLSNNGPRIFNNIKYVYFKTDDLENVVTIKEEDIKWKD